MKMLLLILTTLSSAFALAAKANTEYYFQPAAGANSLDVLYNYNSSPSESTISGTKVDTKSQANDVVLRYLYGWNENNALGAYTFFGSRTYHADVSGGSNASNTASGMGDVHLLWRGFMGVWHYGVDVGLGLSKQKIDNTSGLPDNRATGGSDIKLDFGGLWTDTNWNYGGNISYDFLLERTLDDANDTKVTEGNIARIAAFGEYNHGHGFGGAELSYNMVADMKSKAAGVTSTLKATNFFKVSLFGSWEFTEMVTGLLTLEESMHDSQDIRPGTDENKSYTETGVYLGARIHF